jgi:hypothetical protein
LCHAGCPSTYDRKRLMGSLERCAIEARAA